MEIEKLLIAKVRENRKILIDDVKNRSNQELNTIWYQIAKDCTWESAVVAEGKWKQMVNDYLNFLRIGTTFPHAHEMSFLQQHLISFKHSSSHDLTPEEFKQLGLLFENECGGIKEEVAEEKQLNNVDVINIQDSKDSIIVKHAESTLPGPVELVRSPINANANVVREQNMNVVTTSKDDCIIKTRSPRKFGAQSGPYRVILLPKAPNDNRPRIIHISREPAIYQQQHQPVAVIPLSDQESSDNIQPMTTQPYHEAAVAHAADPLQITQQPPVAVIPSSDLELPDNIQPMTTQPCHEAAVVYADNPLQLQQQQPVAQIHLQEQKPVAVLSSPVPILAEHNEPSGGAQYKDLTSLELIFLGYAKTLQKMPPALRMETKRKITEIIDEAEFRLFE